MTDLNVLLKKGWSCTKCRKSNSRTLSKRPSRTEPAQFTDLAAYEQARQQLAKFSVPVFADAAHPNRKLFVAVFDGTGNSLSPFLGRAGLLSAYIR